MFEKIKEMFKPKPHITGIAESEFQRFYMEEKIRLAPELAKEKAKAEHDAEVKTFHEQSKENVKKTALKGNRVEKLKSGLRKWADVFEKDAKDLRTSMDFGNSVSASRRNTKEYPPPSFGMNLGKEPPPMKIDFGKGKKGKSFQLNI